MTNRESTCKHDLLADLLIQDDGTSTGCKVRLGLITALSCVFMNLKVTWWGWGDEITYFIKGFEIAFIYGMNLFYNDHVFSGWIQHTMVACRLDQIPI